MTILNDHQSRLWSGMLQLIEDFQQGNLRYCDFLDALEGALDAGEFRDRNLVEKWCEFWTPLEIVRAQRGNEVSVEEVKNYVFNMREYLRGVLSEQ